MKKFKELYLVLTFVVLALIGTVMYTGCQSYMNEEGQQVTRLSDAATDKLDKAVQMAPAVSDVLLAVSIAYPALFPTIGIVLGIITGLAGAYRKFRPELTKEQAKTKTYSDTTKAIVYAIEQFKLTNSDDWGDLKAELKKQLLDKVGPESLAIIEAIVQAYYKENKNL